MENKLGRGARIMSWQRQGHQGSCCKTVRCLQVSRWPRKAKEKGSRLSGSPASGRKAIWVWLPSPEKEMLLIAAKRGVSGDPVVKYTSLSCGPRNPHLKASQFPAPDGMIAVFHPEKQMKHHFTDTGQRCFQLRKKGGRSTTEAKGSGGGLSWIKVWEERGVGVLFRFFCCCCYFFNHQ